ncbi:MAG: hypothetical protein KatS3mg015_1274 [Fimbriimonadales bacterium]|nr:MAG: hypothetical protein KatS3mg015_1274 [Fimbriimonadales bacterium]
MKSGSLLCVSLLLVFALLGCGKSGSADNGKAPVADAGGESERPAAPSHAPVEGSTDTVSSSSATRTNDSAPATPAEPIKRAEGTPTVGPERGKNRFYDTKISPRLRELWTAEFEWYRRSTTHYANVLASQEFLAIPVLPNTGDIMALPYTIIVDNQGKERARLPLEDVIYFSGDTVVGYYEDYEQANIRCFNWRQEALYWELPVPGKKERPKTAAEIREELRNWSYQAPPEGQKEEEEEKKPTPIPAAGPAAEATLDGDRLVFTSGGIVELDLKSGKVVRAVPFATAKGEVFGAMEKPVLDNGLCFLVGMHYLYAADRATGRVKWSYYDGANSLPLAANGVVVGHSLVGSFTNGTVNAVDQKTGKLKWSLKEHFGAYCLATHPRTKKKLVICDDGAYDLLTGKKVWKSEVRLEDAVATPNAIVGINNEGIYALDPANGKVLWKDGKQSLKRIIADPPYFYFIGSGSVASSPFSCYKSG